MQAASDRNLYQTFHPPADLISDFKAPQDAIQARTPQFLPAITTLPSISATSPSNTLKFTIPQGGAIDTKSFRLYLRVRVTAAAKGADDVANGWVRLDNGGWGTMIRSINLFESGQIIEQVNHSSVLQSMLNMQTPEDYQEGVLKITEGCVWLEDLPPVGYTGKFSPIRGLGGKNLIVVDSGANADAAAAGTRPLTVSEYTTSVNVPVGLFNTNKPLFTKLYGNMSIEFIFNGWREFLCVSPSVNDGGSVAGVSALATETHGIYSALSVSIEEAELRYDLLTLSPEFEGMLLSSIKELGSFEYPYNSYRLSEHTLTANTTQVIKISGTSQSVLESISFGFIPVASTDAQYPTQSGFISMDLERFYFQIGGLRVPLNDIYVKENTKSDGTQFPFALSKRAEVNNSGDTSANHTEGYVHTLKTQNMFKSYAVGMKGQSHYLIESDAVKVAENDVAGGQTTVYGNEKRRIYGYSFMQSYDQSVQSGFVLGDNSEISLVLKFVTAPAGGERMFVALNYSQKLIVDSSGRVYNQM